MTKRIVRYDTEITHDKIPGFIAGMIDVDSTYVVDFGSASKDEDIQITEHTIFEIGSLTKVFTMSILAILVDEGLLDYNDKVNELLPSICYNKKADSLKLKHLIMHTSGLPRVPTDFGLKEKNPKDPYAFYTKEDLLAFYGSFPFRDLKDDKYMYSHVNFALVEIILEQATAKSYAQLLQEKIIQPLGLKETFLGVDERFYKNAAKGYSLSGQETNFRTFQSFGGSLGLKSSLHDLMIFIRSYLGLGNSSFSEIFSHCFEERISTGLVEKLDIGYAWHFIRHNSYYDVVVHPGRGSGHQVTVHFVPETQTGVIVLANSNKSLDNLGYMMLALVNNHWRLKRKKRRALKEKRRQNATRSNNFK